MNIAEGLFLLLHMVGLAGLLGGFLMQISSPTKKITAMMMHSSWTMLVAGAALMGFVSGEDGEGAVNYVKFGIKLLVLGVIITLMLVNRKKESVDNATFGAIGLLTFTNLVIAILLPTHSA